MENRKLLEVKADVVSGIAPVRRAWAISIAVLASLLLSGCGISIPTDPGGSLDAISGGELRVGVAAETGVATATEPPAGPLPDLVNDFARSVNATPAWHLVSEETLVSMLEADEIDLAVGNFTTKNAWSSDVAVSRPFVVLVDGEQRELVAFLPAGENALLSEFETYADATGRTK